MKAIPKNMDSILFELDKLLTKKKLTIKTFILDVNELTDEGLLKFERLPVKTKSLRCSPYFYADKPELATLYPKSFEL